MKGDKEFNPERFINPKYVEEQTLVDRKRDIPKIYPDLDKRAEYIRDMIAMANASRLRGQPGYLLFGIDDNWNITGIEGQTVQPDLPVGYNSDDPRSVEHLQREIIERAFQNIAEEYIAPVLPVLYYYHGIVKGHRVSYLEIRANPLPTPYEVKRNIDAPKRPLKTRQCWVRRGESKIEIDEQEKQFLYAWTDVPYINHQSWMAYLEALADLSGTSAKNILGYQNLQTVRGKALQVEFDQFIESPSLSFLVIVGHAGSGKTVFVKDRIREAARNLSHEIRLAEGQASSLYFSNYVPIFFPLQNFAITTGAPLAPKLLRQMKSASLLGFDKSETPEKIFKDDGKKWLVVFDGFDESNFSRENRANLWGAIEEFIRLYGNRVKVVLTTRPDITLPSLPDYGTNVRIAQLEKKQVVNFLETQIRPVLLEQLEDFLDFVDSEPELWKHLQNPLFLGTVARYIGGGEIREIIIEEDLEDTSDLREQYPDTLPLTEKYGEGSSIDDIDKFKETIIQLQPIESSSFNDDTDGPNRDSRENNLPNNDAGETNRDPETDKSVDDEEVEEPWLMGKLLNFVFERLWEHNRKKLKTGLNCGDKDETFYELGKMVAHTYDREWLLKEEVKTFLNGKVECILDIGILLRDKATIRFPTLLSKTYFAALFLDVMLRTSIEKVSTIIKDHLEFWNKCVNLLDDITLEDTTTIKQHLNTLRNVKGENVNG